MKHKHYDLIVAWAEGAEIEYLDPDYGWFYTEFPCWSPECQYRIVKRKPETKEVG